MLTIASNDIDVEEEVKSVEFQLFDADFGSSASSTNYPHLLSLTSLSEDDLLGCTKLSLSEVREVDGRDGAELQLTPSVGTESIPLHVSIRIEPALTGQVAHAIDGTMEMCWPNALFPQYVYHSLPPFRYD